MKVPPCLEESETKKEIVALCKQEGIDLRLLTDLCEVVQQQSGSGRAVGINVEITDCIDWFLKRQPS